MYKGRFWERCAKHYGLSQPYEFKVAIPFLLAATLQVLVVLVLAGYLISGEVRVGSLKFNFLCYMVVVLCLAVLLSRWYKVSVMLTIWCVLELSLALVSSNNLSAKLGLVDPRLMPGSDAQSEDAGRFQYHPMLQANPIPNYSSHDGVFVQHNSMGLRGSEVSAEKVRDTVLISVYGGSTTYDIGVRNGRTWPERLQEFLGGRYTVLNFGVPGYSSVEHIVQSVFYSDMLGKYPRCGIYYMGWNDIRNAHIHGLDGAYADFHLLAQINSLQLRAKLNTISPMIMLFSRYLIQWADTIPMPPDLSSVPAGGGSDSRLESIYRKNIETIIAINDFWNTQSIFIGQLLNPRRLTGDQRYGWLPLVKDKDVWPLQVQFNQILRDVATAQGARYIGLEIDQFSNDDFVDNGHFSERGAEKFARAIFPRIHEACSLQCSRESLIV